MQFWSSHLAKDITHLETDHCRSAKIIPSLCNKYYEEKLAQVNMFSLEKCHLQRNNYSVLKFLNDL